MATDEKLPKMERLTLVDLLIKEERVQERPKLRLVENAQVEQTKNTILKRKFTNLVNDYDIVQSKRRTRLMTQKRNTFRLLRSLGVTMMWSKRPKVLSPEVGSATLSTKKKR